MLPAGVVDDELKRSASVDSTQVVLSDWQVIRSRCDHPAASIRSMLTPELGRYTAWPFAHTPLNGEPAQTHDSSEKPEMRAQNGMQAVFCDGGYASPNRYARARYEWLPGPLYGIPSTKVSPLKSSSCEPSRLSHSNL